MISTRPRRGIVASDQPSSFERNPGRTVPRRPNAASAPFATVSGVSALASPSPRGRQSLCLPARVPPTARSRPARQARPPAPRQRTARFPWSRRRSPPGARPGIRRASRRGRSPPPRRRHPPPEPVRQLRHRPAVHVDHRKLVRKVAFEERPDRAVSRRRHHQPHRLPRRRIEHRLHRAGCAEVERQDAHLDAEIGAEVGRPPPRPAPQPAAGSACRRWRPDRCAGPRRGAPAPEAPRSPRPASRPSRLPVAPPSAARPAQGRGPAAAPAPRPRPASAWASRPRPPCAAPAPPRAPRRCARAYPRPPGAARRCPARPAAIPQAHRPATPAPAPAAAAPTTAAVTPSVTSRRITCLAPFRGLPVMGNTPPPMLVMLTYVGASYQGMALRAPAAKVPQAAKGKGPGGGQTPARPCAGRRRRQVGSDGNRRSGRAGGERGGIRTPDPMIKSHVL